MKQVTLLLVSVFIAFSAAAQSEELEVYSALFDEAGTRVQQYGVLQNVVTSGVGTPEFYAKALDRLLSEYPNVRGSTEIAAADSMARLLAAQLGEAGYAEAGPALWRITEIFVNPLVKAEALQALGKTGAAELLPQVVQLLSDLNLKPTEDREMGNQVAYGAILALESYKDAAGYLPVFFASQGWYLDRVKSQALKSLNVILPDPSETLSEVIRSPGYTYDVKYHALQVEENSESTTRSKADVAVAALTAAWNAATGDMRQRASLTGSRKLAVSMIRRYGTEDASVYPLLERSYKEGVDEEEKLGVLAALAALGTDDSARLLSAFLMDFNIRLQRGLMTQADERMVRAVIPALGATGRPIARPALNSVLSMDWTNAVKNLASQALRSIR
jgi:HEAT repeat protein